MKITIIGSTSYIEKMLNHKNDLEQDGNEVKLPAFDSYKDMNEYEVCKYNKEAIEWANIVHVIWDARSSGTIFDLGMCFALQKPIKIIYLNGKTFINFIKQYDEKSERLVFDNIALQSEPNDEEVKKAKELVSKHDIEECELALKNLKNGINNR